MCHNIKYWVHWFKMVDIGNFLSWQCFSFWIIKGCRKSKNGDKQPKARLRAYTMPWSKASLNRQTWKCMQTYQPSTTPIVPLLQWHVQRLQLEENSHYSMTQCIKKHNMKLHESYMNESISQHDYRNKCLIYIGYSCDLCTLW